MGSIKWKCKNWIVYFEKFDNFHLIIFAAVSQKQPFRKIFEIKSSSETAVRMHFSISLFDT